MGDEGVGAVLLRQHGTLIEVDAQCRHVGAEGDDGCRRRPGQRMVGELGGAVAAAAEIGKTEVHSGSGRVVELVRRPVVAHPVRPVVGEVELSRPRMEVQAHRVAHTVGEDLRRAAGDGQTNDGPLETVQRADIAGCAHGHVDPIVRPDGRVAPAVMALVGKAVEQDLAVRGAHVLEVLHAVAHDPVPLGNVEPAVPPGDAVGHLEAAQHLHRPFGPAVPVGIHDRVDVGAPGADENGVERRRHRHGPGAGNPGVDRDPEPGRQAQLRQVPVQVGGAGGERRDQDGRDGSAKGVGPGSDHGSVASRRLPPCGS